MNYLNLIRYKNLIFIVFLMCLMHYCVVNPWLAVFGVSHQLSGMMFGLLVFGTMCISAGGYIINDYFDTKIDALNRPEKVIVGNTISRKTASLMHQIFSAVGVLAGLTVAFLVKSLTLGLIFIMVPGLLWFYSASYKRQFLIGNLVVAFSAALIPIIVLMPEMSLLMQHYYVEDLIRTPIIPTLYIWICGFSAFAFLTTFIREIIKDMEDEYGDREQECRTMAVVLGLKKTKIVVIGLIVLTLLLLSFFGFRFINFSVDTISTKYFIFGLLLPFLYLVYLLFKAKTPSDYGQASTFVKFIMILGSLYSAILYLLLSINFKLAIFGVFQLTAK